MTTNQYPATKAIRNLNNAPINNTSINNAFWDKLTTAIVGKDVSLRKEEDVNMSSCNDIYPMDYDGASDTSLYDKDDTYQRKDVGIADIVEDDVWLYNRGLDRELLVQEERIHDRVWSYRDACYRLDIWRHNLNCASKIEAWEYRSFLKEQRRLKREVESIKLQIADLDKSFGDFYGEEDGFAAKEQKGEELMIYIKNGSRNWSLGKCAMVLDLLDGERANMSYENRILAEGYLLRRLSNDNPQEVYSVVRISKNGNPYESHFCDITYHEELENCKAKYRFLTNDKAKLDDSPSHDDRFFGEMSIGSMEDALDIKRAADSISKRHNISLEESFIMLQGDI